MIKENIAPLLSLIRNPPWFRQIGIFREPHLEGFVIPPITPCPIPQPSVSLKKKNFRADKRLQLLSREILQEIPRLGVEDPKERFVREALDLVPYWMDIVHGVAFW